MLPLAIVKGVELPIKHIKEGVATPWTCNQSLLKPSGFYSIYCSTFTQTPKRFKKIDPPLSALLTLMESMHNLNSQETLQN